MLQCCMPKVRMPKIKLSKHKHDICAYTDCYCSHYHRIKHQSTCESDCIPCGGSHIHYYKVETSKDECHRHYACFYTGPAIPSSCGCGHYHDVYGVTTCDDGHTHNYHGRTSVDDY